MPPRPAPSSSPPSTTRARSPGRAPSWPRSRSSASSAGFPRCWCCRWAAAACSPVPAAWTGGQHWSGRLVGVEPGGATSMSAALAAGHPVPLATIDTFVDGAAVRQVGEYHVRPDRRPSRRRILNVRRRPGLQRDARPVSGRRHHLRAGRRARVGGAGPARRAWPGRRSSASCPAATTTSPAIPRSSSGRWSTRVSSTTSWSRFRRSPERCAGSSTTRSAPTTTSPCSSTSSVRTARPDPPWSALELAHRADLEPLLARLDELPLTVERITPEQVAFRFLV